MQSTQSSQQETAVSDIAKSLTITNQIVVGAIVVITAASSLANLSTMASFWTAINQLQLLFYIFLTGAFIPQDIADVISGLSICLNPFSYLQIKFKGDHSFVSDYFDFGLENSNLEVFEIKSDSTIVNITSFLTSMLIY